MGEFDFTYEIPSDFKQGLSRFIIKNGQSDIAQTIFKCDVRYNILGYAYYEGIKGNNWNKKAVNFTVVGDEHSISVLKSNNQVVRHWIQTYIKPETSGLLIKNIQYYVEDVTSDTIDIILPENEESEFKVLYSDISDALAKDEPVLVLDRLHTYSVKYLRKVCQKYNIPISDNEKFYPLHDLVGKLVKYYEQNDKFETDFSRMAMKMSISLFDSYNDVRNNKSYAHDNRVLNNREAAYVVRMLSATLAFIESIENS